MPTIVNLNLGGSVPAAYCPYNLYVRPLTSLGGSCPYTLRIGGLDEYTATVAASLGNITGTFSGGLTNPSSATITGTLAGITATLNANFVPATVVNPQFTGALTGVLSGVTGSFVTQPNAAGTLAATLADMTGAGVAVYTDHYRIVLDGVVGEVTATGWSGGVGIPPDSFLNITLAGATGAFTGNIVYAITATLDGMLEGPTLLLNGQTQIEGNLAATLDAVTGEWVADHPLHISASDSIHITEAASVDFAWASYETIDLVDVGGLLVHLELPVASEALALTETGSVGVFLTSFDLLHLIETPAFAYAPAGEDAIRVSDSGEAQIAVSWDGLDTLSVGDEGSLLYYCVSAESLTLTETVTVELHASCISSDAITVAESGSLTLQQMLVSVEAFSLLEAGESVIAVTLDSTEPFTVHEQWGVIGGSLDTGACWVLSADTATVSRYTEFPFSSITQFGDVVLLANAQGLYRLTGSTDAGAPIVAAAVTGLQDFGTRLLKRMPTATVDYDLQGDLTLAMTVVNEQGIKDTVRYNVLKVKEGVVDQGRGIRFRWRQLRIEGSAPWTLYKTDEFPQILSRRYGGD